MPAKKGTSKVTASAFVSDKDSDQPSGSGTSSNAAGKKRTRATSSRSVKKANNDQVANGHDDAASLQEVSSANAPPAKKIKKTRAQTEVDDLKYACKLFVTALVDGKMPSLPGVKGTASFPAFALPHTIVALDRLLQIDGFDGFLRKKSMAKYNKLIRAVRDEFPGANAAAKSRAASRDRDELNEQSLFVFSSVAEFITAQSESAFGAEGAMALRKELLDLGVIDIVLLCLAQYAQQAPRCASLHAEDKGKSSGNTSSADALAKFFSAIHSKSRAYFGNVAIDRSLARVEQFYSVQSAKPKSMPAIMKPSYPVANYWEKGTGYGTGTTQSAWNAQQTAAQLRSNEFLVSTLFDVLTAFMVLDIKEGANGEPAAETVVSARFLKMIYCSCVHKALQAYLLNDSVMDISNRTELYRSVLKFATALCRIPQDLRSHRTSTPSTATETAASKKLDRVVEVLNGTSSPVVQLLEKFIRTIDVYLGKLQQASNHKPAAAIKKKAKVTVPLGSGPVTRSRANPEKDLKDPQKEPAPGASSELLLTQVLENAKQALDAVKKRVPRQEKADEPSTSASAAKAATKTVAATPAVPEKTPTELYVGGLGPLQFDSILFFEDDGKTVRFPFYYMNQLDNIGSATNLAKRTRRLAQELVTLQTSLPLNLGSSVFIRASEERLDVMKVLITGPAATPYSNGCFEFDVHFPKTYPDVPMMVNLSTTGNGTVRFNPNLYNDGKVCLSLLNTWSGRPEERWSSNSSLLQVLVSIQSLIFVEDPFFNEPGFERYRGQPFGDKETRRYNTTIQNECVRWAMLEQLRKPSKAFEDVIRRHFWLKRDEICEQVQAWIADLEQYISQVPSTSDPNNTIVFPNRLAALKKNFDDLKSEMRKMKAPEGLEHVRSKQFDKTVEVVDIADDDEPGPSGVQRAKKRTSRTPSSSKAKVKKVAC